MWGPQESLFLLGQRMGRAGRVWPRLRLRSGGVVLCGVSWGLDPQGPLSTQDTSAP